MSANIETLIAEWIEELHTFTHDDADKYIDLVNRTIAALRQADQQAQPVARNEPDRWRVAKMSWCNSLENWWGLATDADKKRAYSSSIESDTWRAKRIRELEEGALDLTSALRELYQVADNSLDYRPEYWLAGLLKKK